MVRIGVTLHRSLRWMGAAILSLAFAGWVYGGEYPAVERLRREKVRAVSAGMGHPVRAQKAKENGLNTFLTWAYILKGWEPGKDFADLERVAFFKREAELAAEYDMLTFPTVWLNTDSRAFFERLDYRRAVAADGRACAFVHCVQDEGFWHGFLKPLFLLFARDQRAAGAAGGAAVDFEYYTGEFIGGYTYGAGEWGCFCDTCFGGFLQAKGRAFDPAAFPNENRFDAVAADYSHREYLAYLSDRVADVAGRLAAEVRAVKPDFLFSFFPAPDNWFAQGVARGWAAPGLPVVLVTGSAYFHGLSPDSLARRDALADWPMETLLVDGLTISTFNAEGLAAKAAELAARLDGYWLYHGEVILSGAKIEARNSGRGSEYVLREPPERHWPALARANAWLDAGAKLDDAAPGAAANLAEGWTADGYVFTADTLRVLEPLPKTGGVLANAAFADGLASWGGGDVTPAVADGALRFDLDGRAAPAMAAFLQTVAVEPKMKYRVRMDIRADGVASPAIGFEITEHYSKNPYFRHWIHDARGVWKTYVREVEPYNNKIDVRFVYTGRRGWVEYRNLRLEQLAALDLAGAPLAADPATVTLDTDRELLVEWINPETGLGYFNLQPGANDLRYLNALFPGLPKALRVSGAFDRGVDRIPFTCVGR